MFPDELAPDRQLPVKKRTRPPSDAAGRVQPGRRRRSRPTAKLCLGVYVPEVLRLLKSQHQTFREALMSAAGGTMG